MEKNGCHPRVDPYSFSAHSHSCMHMLLILICSSLFVSPKKTRPHKMENKANARKTSFCLPFLSFKKLQVGFSQKKPLFLEYCLLVADLLLLLLLLICFSLLSVLVVGFPFNFRHRHCHFLCDGQRFLSSFPFPCMYFFFSSSASANFFQTNKKEEK